MNIDTSIYSGLRNVLTSCGQFQSIVDMFRNNNSSRLRTLQQHIENKNLKQAALILHAIKGSCRMFGEIDCAETCELLEKNKLARKTLPTHTDLDELKKKLNAFTDFLETEAKGKSHRELTVTSLRNAQ